MRTTPGVARVLLGFVLLSNPAVAVREFAVVEVASASGPGWAAQDLRLDLQFDASAAELRIAHLTLPAPIGRLDEVVVECPALRLTRHALECRQAAIGFRPVRGERVVYAVDLGYTARTKSFSVDLPEARIADGVVSLSAVSEPAGARIAVDGRALSLAQLHSMLASSVDDGTGISVESGDVHARFELRLAADGSAWGSGEGEITEFAFSNASGRVATEGVVARSVIELARQAGGPWSASVEAGVGAGGIYAEPVYLDFAAYPLALRVEVTADPVAGRLHLERFELEQPGLARLAGSLRATRSRPLESLVLEIEHAALPGAYDTYLAGVLVGTPFDRLDTAGNLTGRLELDDGVPTLASFTVSNLNLEDRDGRFALYGAGGELHWQRSEQQPRTSRLAFDGGFLYGAGFDGAQMQLLLAGSGGTLLSPVRVPLLGGAFEIRTLSVTNWDSDDIALELEAEVEPIELRQLTVALGWPAFGGTLSGRLPLLNYRSGVVTLGGNLEARAFDGEISIEQLRINQPFGIVPELSASIRLRNLDLGLVTDVVPFGSVSGRLDGDIENLRMLKGEPIGFDASFRTPEDDDSKHRISQRAVGTISKVAGGGGAVLSSTFLSVFQSFPYKRLGISCRLENDICHMDGIAPTDGGYYIVEGGLLPRLNLIGRVREVSWSRLIGQLKQALEEGQLEIE